MLRKITFALITIVILLGIGYFALKLRIEQYEKEKVQQAIAENILSGVSLEPTIVKVDYARKIAEGSPLVFGGSHSPPKDHASVWNEYEKAGITSIRKDLYVEFTLPRNISLEAYKKNANNEQDISTWDKNSMDTIRTALNEAKKHNMRTIGIMAYAPRWLTYNGSPHGVPKDWEVYKEIVKKVYALYRNNLDYVEIWNEPDHRIFLVTDKSNMSKEEAYANIYITASNAIREVDNEKNDGKHVKIIGGVESNARVSKVMNYLVNQSDMNIKPDFISFHTYDSYTESLEIYKQFSRKIGTPRILITEWNYESGNKTLAARYKTGDMALTFTATRLMDYLKSGIYGANYFSLLPVTTADVNGMGFYKWNQYTPEMLPQANSWRILSKSLGLGKGISTIVASDSTEGLQTIGFKNANNVKGSAVVNETDEQQLIEFHLKNANIPKRVRFEVYVVSSINDGGTPVASRLVYPENGNLTFRYLVPEKGILGITFTEETEWYDILDPIINLDIEK